MSVLCQDSTSSWVTGAVPAACATASETAARFAATLAAGVGPPATGAVSASTTSTMEARTPLDEGGGGALGSKQEPGARRIVVRQALGAVGQVGNGGRGARGGPWVEPEVAGGQHGRNEGAGTTTLPDDRLLGACCHPAPFMNR